MNKTRRAAACVGVLLLLAGSNSLAQIQTYCTNIQGNISCTSYDSGSSSQTFCSSIGGNLSCTTYSDSVNQVQMRQNYVAGQIIGSAIGNAVVAAIEEYKAHKRIQKEKTEQWNQVVQDAIGTVQLACETDPKHEIPVLDCRRMMLIFNQFLHLHQKDFVPDGKNVKLLAEACEGTSDDPATWSEQTLEIAFNKIDKKRLDKKIFIGWDANRIAW